MSQPRTSARVVLLDDDGAVLLLRGSDPAITDGSAPRCTASVNSDAASGEAPSSLIPISRLAKNFALRSSMRRKEEDRKSVV